LPPCLLGDRVRNVPTLQPVMNAATPRSCTVSSTRSRCFKRSPRAPLSGRLGSSVRNTPIEHLTTVTHLQNLFADARSRAMVFQNADVRDPLVFGSFVWHRQETNRSTTRTTTGPIGMNNQRVGHVEHTMRRPRSPRTVISDRFPTRIDEHHGGHDRSAMNRIESV